jgi:hypothetical protein
LNAWKTNIDRADKLFLALTPDQLEKEIAPGKNRLIYLWGHLTAVHDRMLPLLGFGPRLHPELDDIFLSKPDRSVQKELERSKRKTPRRLRETFTGRVAPKARGRLRRRFCKRAATQSLRSLAEPYRTCFLPPRTGRSGNEIISKTRNQRESSKWRK